MWTASTVKSPLFPLPLAFSVQASVVKNNQVVCFMLLSTREVDVLDRSMHGDTDLLRE